MTERVDSTYVQRPLVAQPDTVAVDSTKAAAEQKKEPVKVAENKQVEGKGTTVERTTTNNPAPRAKAVVPKDWYPAKNDAIPAIKDLTVAQIRKACQNGQTAADYILDLVLNSKHKNVLSDAERADLKAKLIKANPSVFNENGMLKEDANLKRLDIPSRKYLRDNYSLQDASKSKTGKNVSPKGWYRASNDKRAEVQKITIKDMEAAQKSGKNAAKFVMETVLKGKMVNILNKEQQRQLLADFINNNPSLFYKNGTLRNDAKIDRLDVPTVAYIKEKFGITTKNTKQPENNATTTRDVGYSKRREKDGTYTYFNPQGQEISGAEYRKHCPNS